VDCGYGFFFAAMMAIGIAIVGVAVNYSMLTSGPFFEGPRFEPWAMVGGAAWMVGNLMTPTIIRLVGLGIGLSIWDLSNMVMGWATGSFGLFGVWKETVKCPWMNYLGLALAGVSLILFTQAMEQPEGEGAADGEAQRCEHERKKRASSEVSVVADLESGCAFERKPFPRVGTTLTEASTEASVASLGDEINLDVVSLDSSDSGEEPAEVGADFVEEGRAAPSPEPTAAVVGAEEDKRDDKAPGTFPTSAWKLQAMGFSLAIVAGLLFGYTFDTAIPLMQDGRTGGPHSANSLDFVLSHFCGILAMGIASLLVYVLVRRGRSYTPPKLVLPSVFSGMLWGIAQAAWFRANEELSVVVAFPIVSSLPGIVALAWGVFCFGELQSARSRRFAAAGLAVRIPSVLLIAFSNQVP
jgi:glucose uptake protein GlcU